MIFRIIIIWQFNQILEIFVFINSWFKEFSFLQSQSEPRVYSVVYTCKEWQYSDSWQASNASSTASKKNFLILNLEYNFLYEESSLSLVIEDVVSAYVEEPLPHLYLHLLRISSAPRATGARYDFVFAWLFIIYCILGQWYYIASFGIACM